MIRVRKPGSGHIGVCQLITAPEPSVEGLVIHAIKLGKGSGPNRRGTLALGGVHARELVNPDMLVTLALRLCQSYTKGGDIVLGGRTYPADTVKLILDSTGMGAVARRLRDVAQEPADQRGHGVPRRRPQPQLRFPVRRRPRRLTLSTKAAPACWPSTRRSSPRRWQALASDGDLRDRCIALLRELRPALATATGGGTPVPDDMIRRIDELAASFARRPGTPPAIARSARKLAH